MSGTQKKLLVPCSKAVVVKKYATLLMAADTGVAGGGKKSIAVDAIAMVGPEKNEYLITLVAAMSELVIPAARKLHMSMAKHITVAM